jgi:diaminopimelate decarboxylase
MIHVIGVVTALTDKSVTVETTDKKSVDVVLAGTTTYAKDKKAAALSDLKVGDRVVIHAMKMNGALQAHTVEFSEAKH